MDNRKIIKWSGSKTYLSHYVDAFIEDSFARGTLKKNFNYYEPFFGSGAVFFHIKKKYQIKSAYLNDNLHELIYLSYQKINHQKIKYFWKDPFLFQYLKTYFFSVLLHLP